MTISNSEDLNKALTAAFPNMTLSNTRQILSFNLLEDVMNSSEDIQDRILRSVGLFRIGPLIEFLIQTSRTKIDLFDVSNNAIIDPLRRIIRLNNYQQLPFNTSLSNQHIEFFRCYENQSQIIDGRWFAFCKRLQEAAKSSGLNENFAKALAGTFGEMVGNVFEHSDFPNSGLVGYRWQNSEFEYVVADSGIGVLNSLLKNPEYSSLRDSGEALETALEDGKSSCLSETGRGFGFHELIKNIANRNSYIRFRSGDHYLTMDGTKDRPLKEIKSSSQMNGFLISIICKS